MYNFQNVNDYEFELICKDILELETGLRFQNFTSGRDGGIDIRAFSSSKIIAQVKHYIYSNPNNLISSLKNELDKVKQIKPDDYYIFTSLGLSPQKIDEIYTLFKDYMASKENIFDRARIDSLLNKCEYSDIINRHYKLWLTSTNILNNILNQCVTIDTNVLMHDIHKESKLFVKTVTYDNVLKVLENKRIVTLIGCPGVGKTTLSKMLVLHYATNGYKVRYTFNSDIRDVKNSLTQSKDVKEIILLDDFLGQHYLNINEQKPNEIKSLILYILMNPNKKLIINSRITILNEAKRKYQSFKTFIEDGICILHEIDIEKMSCMEKAKILYNHMYFNQLDSAHCYQLFISRRYIKIIEHENFNPRIIEYITNSKILNTIESKNYYEYVLSKLDNPQDIWDEEFLERIEEVDRTFLYCLYTLTDTFIDQDIFNYGFNSLIDGISVDKTKNYSNICLQRLNGSFVKIVVKDSMIFISVLNPSINDYLYSLINENSTILNHLLNNVVYYEQYLKLSILNCELVDDIILKKIYDKSFFNLKTVNVDLGYYLLEIVLKKRLMHENILIEMQRVFSSINLYNLNNNTSKYNGTSRLVKFKDHLFKVLYDVELSNYYKLYDIVINYKFVEKIIECFNYEDIVLYVNLLDMLNSINYFEEDDSRKNIIVDIIVDVIPNVIERDILHELNYNIDDLISDLCEDISFDIISHYYFEGDNELLSIVKQILSQIVQQELHEIIRKCSNSSIITIISNVDVENITSQIDFEDELDICLKYMFEEEEDDYSYDEISSNDSNYSEIDRLFSGMFVKHQ